MKTAPKILLAVFAGLFLALSSADAQETKPAADAAPAVHHKSLWEKLREGGWVMVPIGLCSVVTLYLIGDGIIRVTSPKKVLPSEHLIAVRNLFRAGKYADAYNYCKAKPSPFTNVCRVALSSLGEGKMVVEEEMMGEIAKENSRMQTFIAYLSVIGVCAPMIGLLGTVTGMIKAFETLGSSGIGDPSSLSAAIGEVLVATASGLFIAIPAFTAFYYLRSRAAKAIHDIQDTMASLLRKMPYEKLAGVHIGDEEIYAADPEWWTGQEETQPAHL